MKFQEQAEILNRDKEELRNALQSVETQCDNAAKQAEEQSREVEALGLEAGRLLKLQADTEQQVDELTKAVKDSEQLQERYKASHAEKSTQLAEIQLQAISASEQE